MSSKHFRDLRHAYAKYMEYHGIGYALYNPVAAEDITPPCIGFINDNGDWNLIANLSTSPTPEGLTGLAYEPRPVTQIDISWKPKTSLGVDSQIIDAGVETPDNLPGGAGLHVKYSSNNSFLAVLMTTNPITQVAYNEERLFCTWLDENRATLYKKHGAQLKKHGLWLVTRTHAAPNCSINATTNKSQDVTVSLAAKAHMLGEISGDVTTRDDMFDKDWSHYNACTPGGLVLFIDGLYVSNWEWKMEPIRGIIPKWSEASRRAAASIPSYGRISPIALVPQPPQIIVDERKESLNNDLHFPSGLEVRGRDCKSVPSARSRRRSSQAYHSSASSTPEFQDAQQDVRTMNKISLDERAMQPRLSIPKTNPSPYPSVQQLQQQHSHKWLEALQHAAHQPEQDERVEDVQDSKQDIEIEVEEIDSEFAADERTLRDIGAFNALSLVRSSSLADRSRKDSQTRSLAGGVHDMAHRSSRSPDVISPRSKSTSNSSPRPPPVAPVDSRLRFRSHSQSPSRRRARSQSKRGTRSTKVVSLYLDSHENVLDVEQLSLQSPESPPTHTQHRLARQRSGSPPHSTIADTHQADSKQLWRHGLLARGSSPKSLRRETRSISSTLSGSASEFGDFDLSEVVEGKDFSWS